MIAEVALKSTPGEHQEPGSSARVTAMSIIGFNNLTYQGLTYKKGAYYGGYVVSQPNASVITSLSGQYYEGGAYVTASGSTGYSTGWGTTTTFSTANHTSRKTQTLSRSNYFNPGDTTAMVASKFIVGGTVNGSPFSFNVTANAF